MKKLLLVLVALVVVVGLILAGCSGSTVTNTVTSTTTQTVTSSQTTQTTTSSTSTSTTPVIKKGGTLTVIYPYMGTSLGWPPKSQGGYSMYQQLCLEPLVQQMMDGTFVPRLATDWTIGADKTITFTLRQNVKFHDGTAFNAAAVKFNLDAMSAEKRGGSINWASVDVIDDYHIKVTYTNWTNWAISDFTYAGVTYMVSPAAFEKYGPDDIKNHMVGTGPFVQTDWQQDVYVKFDANKNYWQTGKPYLDKLVVLCVSDPVTAQTTILSGDADILNSEADQKVVDMKAKGLSAVTRPVGVMNFFMDTANTDSPFAIKANREAMEYAMDKVSMCKTLNGGLMTPAYWMAPPNVPSYKEIAGRKYDPAKAQALLAEAGNPNGYTFTLYPVPVPMFNNSATAIQSDLDKVGIKADLQIITDAKFGEIVMGTWSDAAVLAAVSSCIPNWTQALSTFFAPNGILYKPMLRSDAFTAAYNTAAYSTEYDNATTQALLQEMYDEENTIPCFYTSEAWIFQSYVKGAWDVWPSGLQMWSPENAWLDK